MFVYSGMAYDGENLPCRWEACEKIYPIVHTGVLSYTPYVTK